MTWELTEWGASREPLSGVPWRDLSDEEFAEAEALFEEGVLRERGYFEQVTDAADDSPEPRRADRASKSRKGS